jgi:hypothetical protein
VALHSGLWLFQCATWQALLQYLQAHMVTRQQQQHSARNQLHRTPDTYSTHLSASSTAWQDANPVYEAMVMVVCLGHRIRTFVVTAHICLVKNVS